MNSRKPSLRLPNGYNSQGRVVQIPKRVEPKRSDQPNLGPCLLCGDTFEGPTSIRLKHGCITSTQRGPQFSPLPFEDRTLVKWLCIGCALDNNIVEDDVSGFSSRLNGLRSDGQCCLCGHVIEPYPLEDWSSAILIEFGETIPSNKGPFSIFRPGVSGHLHYFCMDDLNLELWRIIDRSDEPDYEEFLPECR